MARVRSTARITRDGEEAKAAETGPISEVMRQSGLVVTEGASDEGAPTTEAEQADIEEGNADEDKFRNLPKHPQSFHAKETSILL